MCLGFPTRRDIMEGPTKKGLTKCIGSIGACDEMGEAREKALPIVQPGRRSTRSG